MSYSPEFSQFVMYVFWLSLFKTRKTVLPLVNSLAVGDVLPI